MPPWEKYQAGPWSKYAQEPPPGYGGADVDTSEVPMEPFSPEANRKASEQVSRYQAGAMKGIQAPVYGVQQMVSNLIGGAEKESSDERIRAFNEKYRAKGAETDEGQAGQMVGGGAVMIPAGMAAPGMGAASLLGRTAAGAAAGGALSATTPVDPNTPNYWNEKAWQAGTGAAVGGGLTAGLSGVARMVSPQTLPDVKKLIDAGVETTPGQTLGGAGRYAEETLKKMPGIGYMVGKAEQRSIDTYNRAVMNDALKPIGQTIAKETPVGRQAVDEMITKSSGAYKDVLPRVNFGVEKEFAQDVAAVQGSFKIRPKAEQDQLKAIVSTELVAKLKKGPVSGETFKEIDSTLGRLASEYKADTSADKRALGSAIRDIQTAMRDSLARQNPAEVNAINAANEAWGKILRVEQAAEQSKTGVFTPAQFEAAVKKLSPVTSGKRMTFARGGAQGQDMSEAAIRVLPSKEPNSGSTAGVLAGLGLAGGYAYDPETALKVGGAAALMASPYTRTGGNAVRSMLTRRGPLAEPTAGMLRRLGPGMTPGLLELGR